MSKAYFSLIVRFDRGDRWAVQFGDYDRETVQAEAEEYGDAYRVKIIKTAPDQSAINLAVALQNAKLTPALEGINLVFNEA